MLENLRDKTKSASAGISLSPIDTLINTIEKTRKPADVGGAGHDFYRVRECAGRSFQIEDEGGTTEQPLRWPAQNSTTSNHPSI